MTIPEQLTELIDRHVLSHSGFAIYRLPSTKQMGLVVQTQGRVIQLCDAGQLNGISGFALIPYAASSLPLVVIKPQVCAFSIESIISTLEALPHGEPQCIKELPTYNASKEEYCEAFGTFVDRLKEAELSKIVLARSSQTKAISSFGEVFIRACEQNPDSFVYLCNTPESGVWLGATPETLVTSDGQKYTTMALAGTRPIGGNGEPWSTKNQEEQQYVSDFIHNQISSVSSDISLSPTTTLRAGNVEHLCSRFTFTSAVGIGDIVLRLHPTPAVCGVPQDVADYIIRSIEPNERLYYSGAVGIIGLQHSDALYVNLRCLYANDHSTTLFAGGGILEQSEVEAEWDETEAKMKTISSIL